MFAKSLFELYLTIPGEMLPAFSFAFMAHLSYANLILTQLLFLQDQDWNALTARQTVDYPNLAQRLSDHFETCEQLISARKRRTLEDGRGLFLKYAENLRWTKNWYLSKLSVDSAALDAVVQTGNAVNDLEYATWNMLFVSNSV
ncbi:hypothetical protein SLS62_011251 [Diatrype stigma]|uniref:Uncharacterized protein n=1 Tax=Diatrype stigma TaxID=117547 RepID=A0AAN9U6H9_9PEZI